MGFVAAKCTQCGANIEVDESKDAGICKYCGTAFVTEKAINNYNTYITNNYDGATVNIIGGNVENLLELAEIAERAGNHTEANEYYSKILEIEPQNRKALFRKGYMACLVSNVYDINSEELLVYARRALTDCSDDKFCYYALQELGKIRYLIHENIIKEYNKTWEDEDSFYMLVNGLVSCFNIALYEIEYTKDKYKTGRYITYYRRALEFGMKYCAELCKERSYRDFSSDRILNIKVSTDLHKEYLDAYNMLRDMAKEIEEKESVDIPEINRDLNVTQGCYIATCIYGSYDCPQVWTLRRFRDTYLHESMWGRTFIRGYYRISPKLVDLFGNNEVFCLLWKAVLDKMVKVLNNKGYTAEYYEDPNICL